MAFGLDGRIPVCMRCGSREVRHQTSGDGLWAAGGEGVAWVCDRCHHIGSPFLMDQDAEGARADPLWRTEYEEAAFGLEDEAWHPRPRSSGRTRALGATFAAVGTLFLMPVASALHQAAASGPYAVVRALVGTGWLLAIGLAMIAVGIRRIRDARAEALPHASDEDDALEAPPEARGPRPAEAEERRA